jgi:Zn-finger nucleic acid-binding protein
MINKNQLVCPQSHGFLASSHFVKTNFVGKIYSALWRWTKVKQIGRQIRCPACAGTMLELEAKGTEINEPRLRVDCCSYCFSVWLDTGEDLALKNQLQTEMTGHQPLEKPNELFRYGQLLLERENYKIQVERIKELGDTLNRKYWRFGNHPIALREPKK